MERVCTVFFGRPDGSDMGNRSHSDIRRQRTGRPRRVEPPMVMWPAEDSGFEPSAYSPAGQLQQAAQIMENVEEDPAGVWRAIRGSWGLRIIVGGLAVLAALGGLSALLHL